MKPYGTSLQAFKEYCILSKPVNYFERFLVGHANSWYTEVVRRQTSLHPVDSLVDLIDLIMLNNGKFPFLKKKKSHLKWSVSLQ